MPDRALELKHLAEANRHLAQAEQRIDHLRSLIEEGSTSGLSTDAAKRSLDVMQDVLQTFRDHRKTIVQTIADIDAGKYR